MSLGSGYLDLLLFVCYLYVIYMLDLLFLVV